MENSDTVWLTLKEKIIYIDGVYYIKNYVYGKNEKGNKIMIALNLREQS